MCVREKKQMGIESCGGEEGGKGEWDDESGRMPFWNDVAEKTFHIAKVYFTRNGF